MSQPEFGMQWVPNAYLTVGKSIGLDSHYLPTYGIGQRASEASLATTGTLTLT